jgi:2-keto-3-deoxy-L-fuconate dehydrogenase
LGVKMSVYQPAGKGQPPGFGDFLLTKKVAIVTGGASGIGLCISQLFARKGAHVQILDVNLAEAQSAVNEINKTAMNKATAYVCDVASKDSVESCVKSILGLYTRIDILVNNAGIAAVGKLELATEADMQRCFDVNVRGVFLCSQAVIKSMTADGRGGAILNLASIASVIGLADRFAYSMSKGAVLTMTYSIATDYVKQGVRCNCMTPGRIHTPFVDGYLNKAYPGQQGEMYAKLATYQPIGRMGKPHEVAALALYLCSDEASFVTGAAYAIDGGVACRM